MQKQSKFLSWAAYPSTEVFNGSMLLGNFAKLELLLRLGLKTSTLTPGVLCIALLGVRTILSTCALFHAVSMTISFELIVWSSLKLFSERPLRDISIPLVMRSSLMTTGLKRTGLNNILQILSILWVSTFGSLLGSTYLLESLILSTWLPDS